MPALTLTLTLTLTWTATATASPDTRARAAESFRQAQAAFERRDFAAAAASFEAAAGFVPHPAALLSAADAWERAGDLARAADDCDRSRTLPNVAEASASDHVEYAHDAAACVERLRPRLSLLEARGSGALALRVDGGPEQVLPVRRWLRPGHHVLAVVDLGASRTRTIALDLAAAEERTIDLAPEPSPAAAQPPAATVPALAGQAPALAGQAPALAGQAPLVMPARGAPRAHPVPTGAWVAFGVAAPATVAYGVFSFMTLGAQQSYDANPTQDGRTQFYRDRTLADVSFGVAAVALATGLVVWLALASPSHEPLRSGP